MAVRCAIPNKQSHIYMYVCIYIYIYIYIGRERERERETQTDRQIVYQIFTIGIITFREVTC